MSIFERSLSAAEFLSHHLTSRERMLVAAFALGYNQVEVARAWAVSPPAVHRMAQRIYRKAQKFWKS